MTFPKYHFNEWWNIHDSRANHISDSTRTVLPYGSGRSFVANWGRLGGAYIDGDTGGAEKKTTVRTQIDKSDWSLTAVGGGSFPLQPQPNRLESNFPLDICMGRTVQNRVRLKQRCDMFHANALTRNRERTRRMRAYSEALRDGDLADVEHYESCLAASLQYLLGEEIELLDDGFVQSACTVVSPRYSGGSGCVSSTEYGGRTALFYTSGAKMDQVHGVVLNDEDGEALPILVPSFQFDIAGQRIYQVSTHHSTGGTDPTVLIRGDQCLTTLSLSPHDSDISIRNSAKHSFDFDLYSADVNPFIPGEYLVTGEDRIVLRSDVATVYSRTLYPRSSAYDTWTWARIGGHPRQILFADRSQLLLLDTRTTAEHSLDLFALPSDLLNSNERLFHCAVSDGSASPYSCIATDFNLIVVDRRMPGHSVLQWTSPLLQPVQYSHWLAGSGHLLVGSQELRETGLIGLDLSLTSRHPPVLKGSLTPGILASDPSENSFVGDRLAASSQLGVCGIQRGDRLYTLALTTTGDLFGQILAPETDNRGVVRQAIAARWGSWADSLRQFRTPPSPLEIPRPFAEEGTSRVMTAIDFRSKPSLLNCKYCREAPIPLPGEVKDWAVCENCCLVMDSPRPVMPASSRNVGLVPAPPSPTEFDKWDAQLRVLWEAWQGDKRTITSAGNDSLLRRRLDEESTKEADYDRHVARRKRLLDRRKRRWKDNSSDDDEKADDLGPTTTTAPLAKRARSDSVSSLLTLISETERSLSTPSHGGMRSPTTAIRGFRSSTLASKKLS